MRRSCVSVFVHITSTIWYQYLVGVSVPAASALMVVPFAPGQPVTDNLPHLHPMFSDPRWDPWPSSLKHLTKTSTKYL